MNDSNLILLIVGVLLVSFVLNPELLIEIFDLFMLLLKKLGFAPHYQSVWGVSCKPSKLEGSNAVVNELFSPDTGGEIYYGKVTYQGELWNAYSKSPKVTNLAKGDTVIISKRKGLSLEVTTGATSRESKQRDTDPAPASGSGDL